MVQLLSLADPNELQTEDHRVRRRPVQSQTSVHQKHEFIKRLTANVTDLQVFIQTLFQE